MNEIIDISKLDPNFKYEIAESPGGENFKLCFSCGICTASCPVFEIYEDYNPRKLIRIALLGMKKEVLASEIIWYCSICYTCYARCPQNVKFTNIMSILREMAVKEGYAKKELLEKVKNIDKLSQKIRFELLESILKKRTSEEIKSKLLEILDAEMVELVDTHV